MRTERLSDIKKIAHLHRMLAQATSNRSEPIKELAPIFPASLTKSEGQAKKAGSSEPAKQAPQTTAAVAQSKKKGRGKKRN
ncbi:hypothetical protein GGI18_005764 [Coemansia linderi]|nr:hypothetical protein GGI18_005764 [Coemansia linderi]